MGDDAECSRHHDESDRGHYAQQSPEEGADCGDQAGERTDGRQCVDGLYHLFADRDRRHALYYLDEADGAVPIGELVARLAERSSSCPGTSRSAPETGSGSAPERGDGSPPSEVDGLDPNTESETVLTSLHHVHLPKLVDAGAVSYDRESGVVVPSIDGRLSAVLDGARSLESSGDAGER